MPIVSAGLLMCRRHESDIEFFLVHPGGPYFKNKHEGAWTIPKGIVEPDEDHLQAAQREFFEETGINPTPPFHALGSIKQKGGKLIFGWSFIASWNEPVNIRSNTFALEWPPKSGKMVMYPEIDQAEWMDIRKANRMINTQQIPFLTNALRAYSTNVDVA